MTKTQKEDLLSAIIDRQEDNAAPVTLQIGYVDSNNIVRSSGILITEAPPVIIQTVMKWVEQQSGAFAAMQHGGLFIS